MYLNSKKVYIITYDLNKPGQNYDDVINAIKKASDGNWYSYWKSSYIIRSNYQTANEVFAVIKPYIDANDRIIVCEIVNNNQGWLPKEAWSKINSLFNN